MNQNLAEEIAQEFYKITSIKCNAIFMKKGENHFPTSLQKNEQGVYVFLIENKCFKVGKAGAKSQARWNSHHYNLDKTTPSTFSKTLIKDKENFKLNFNHSQQKEIDNLNPKNIKKWIKNNISRIEFKISNSESKFSLSLLESLVQYKLEPIYEGKLKNLTSKSEAI